MPVAAQAQDRPGIDRPIRVGMFKGTGISGRYWHTNIHTSHAVVANILANPAGSNLGADLPVPPKGFSFYSMPVAPDSTGGECAGNGCGPTFAQIAAFVAALDTLDIILMNSVTDFGSRVTNMDHRNAIADFWTRKGYVAVHCMTDSPGTWGSLDTIHGARFRFHPQEQAGTLRRDSAFDQEPAWQYLNRGVFSNGLDTSHHDEWMYFTTSGATIRGNAYLRPTMKLDEGSIANPGSGAPMGDHPMSWYKHLPTGGRFFYTALGHRADIWQNARTFRRQLYNAILWTARYESLSALPSSIAPGRGLDPGVAARAPEVSLRVENGYLYFANGSPARVSVRMPDGRLVARREGISIRIPLRSGAVYLVTVHLHKSALLLRRVVMP
jgi:hypothetical protein